MSPSRVRVFASSMVVCIVLGGSKPSTQSSPQYAVLDVGPGDRTSVANDLDWQGRVVGMALQTTERSFLDDGTKLVYIDTAGATLGGPRNSAVAINSSGVIAGWSDIAGTYDTQGYTYDGLSAIALGTLGGKFSTGRAINDFGAVVGKSSLPHEFPEHAFFYDGTTMKDLGTLGGPDSSAYGVNNSGWVTGMANVVVTMSSPPPQHAFLYRDNAMQDLGTLGGMNSVGRAINEDGMIVGQSDDTGGAARAFVYDGSSMRSLGTLGLSSEALGLNDAGDIVGESEVAAATSHAFLYSSGQLVDLNTLIAPDSGWILTSARAINDAGQIVGSGFLGGRLRAFRLTPAQDVTIASMGVQTNQDSNIPNPVEAGGRTVTFVMSVSTNEPYRPSAKQSVVLSDTVSGAVEIVSADVADGNGPPCAIVGQVVTCTVTNLGYGATKEVWVTVRPTAAGAFGHTARVTGSAPDPDVSNNVISEQNTAVSLADIRLTPSVVEGGKTSSLAVYLTSEAPGSGATVTLQSSNPAVAPVPSSIYVLGSGTTRNLNLRPNVVTSSIPVTITATYGLQTRTATLTVNPPPVAPSLPSPWASADIGATGAAGQSSVSGGTFTVRGGGADVWGTADAFQFTYQTLEGDGEVVARVASLQNVNAWTKAGVMIRQSLSAGSAHAMMAVSPGKGAAFQRRPATGGASSSTAGPLVAAPYWVKVVRTGETLAGYVSASGTAWTLVGTDRVPMTGTVYAGLVVSSHVAGTLATGTFDGVNVAVATTTSAVQ